MGLDVYPNPVSVSSNQQILLSMLAKKEEWIDIAVYNTLGEKLLTVFHGRPVSQQFILQLSLEGKGIHAGIYFCVVRSVDKTVSTPLVVLQ